MIFTCSKNITVGKIKFKENVFYCSEVDYKRFEKILKKYNPTIPIKGNDGLIINKKEKAKVKAKK